MADVTAAAAAIALIPLGWALYIAKLLELVERDTLDSLAIGSLLVASGLAGLAVLPRLPTASAVVLAGFAAVPAAAWALGGPPLAAAFAYGTAALGLCWLLARLRQPGPAVVDAFYRGRGGVALVLLAPALVAFAGFSGFPSWVRLVGTLAALVAALTCQRRAAGGWRVVSALLAGLAFALVVLELLVIYGIYPLLPVAVPAVVAPAAGIAYGFALVRGAAALRAKPG